jgi:formate hydrogenlyase subunit 6/NADH:ubiquinone oxidoreductase subunit I
MTKILERATPDGTEQRQSHIIDLELCERCALCVEVCKFDVIIDK